MGESQAHLFGLLTMKRTDSTDYRVGYLPACVFGGLRYDGQPGLQVLPFMRVAGVANGDVCV